jgi:hypothetical protein
LYQALGEASHEEHSSEELDRIWRAVAGELPAAERRDLVDRMATDPALAEAWRAALELQRASASAEATTGRSWSRSWLAAAALLLLGVGIGVFVQFPSPSRDGTVREPAGYAIEPLVPADTALPREAFRLRWTPGPQDSRYQVRVTTEDLQVLATVSDLGVPELVLDAGALSAVAPGARVFWQVDATLPGGERVSSETFIVRVQ